MAELTVGLLKQMIAHMPEEYTIHMRVPVDGEYEDAECALMAITADEKLMFLPGPR